ncbi:MAG: RNA pseudouridine synthase [Pyrinomonas sp.]|uniref:RluA family pseudouridine synthase n=1 Tax=Pyrinomonas sp. TaxID=2080306 RepID=UPI003319EC82
MREHEADPKLEDEAAALDVEMRSFIVGEEDQGKRLDVFLAARIADWSRASIKRVIEAGEALVDGREVKPAYRLRVGERVEIELSEIRPTNLQPEQIPLDIVYEDDVLVVINKPAGLVVHPGAGVHSGTLANALAYHFAQLSTRGGPLRPGIVHRLDRETSGLIVVAKNEAAHEKLAEQFQSREVLKSYVALVHGRVAKESGRISEPIGRHPSKRTRMAVVRDGRPALTLYRVRRRFKRFTLLDVVIKTGRTHQIRVHLAWLKHPVVGDSEYGQGRDRTVPDLRLRALVVGLRRQFLHAEKLGFTHPRTGEWMEFLAPLPAELEKLLVDLERVESE